MFLFWDIALCSLVGVDWPLLGPSLFALPLPNIIPVTTVVLLYYTSLSLFCCDLLPRLPLARPVALLSPPSPFVCSSFTDFFLYNQQTFNICLIIRHLDDGGSSTCELSVYSNKTIHGAISQKAVIFSFLVIVTPSCCMRQGTEYDSDISCSLSWQTIRCML
jgi:hypothetical protein